MITATYPRIGQTVNYVRQANGGGIETGSGRVLAICLGEDKRLMLHLDNEAPEGSQKFNVDLNCVNPTPDFIDRFTVACDTVAKISKRGNDIVAETVKEFNLQVEAEYVGILGEKLCFDHDAVEVLPQSEASKGLQEVLEDGTKEAVG